MNATANRTNNAYIARVFWALTGRSCTVRCERRPGAGTPDDGDCFANLYLEGQQVAAAHGQGHNPNDARQAVLVDMLRRLACKRTARALEERTHLRRSSLVWLRGEYKRSHRVSDTRELTKGDLVAALLVEKFGRDIARAALHLPKYAAYLLEQQVVVPAEF